jgi:hypothetical protein
VQPFEGSRQRIERAEGHRETLANVWNRFIENDPYITVVRIDNNGAGRILVSPAWTMPGDLPLVLGEMLYQFRAALDGAVYEAATLESSGHRPPNEKSLQFPICPSIKEFRNAARNIAPLSEKCRAFIEKVQPYNSPELTPDLRVFNFNRSLGILNDWARKDRHRRLHVIGSIASNATPKIRLPLGARLSSMVIAEPAFLKNETQIASFQIDGYTPGMNVQANPDLCIDITVDERPLRCAGNDTFANRLMAISRAVKVVVAGLEEIVCP